MTTSTHRKLIAEAVGTVSGFAKVVATAGLVIVIMGTVRSRRPGSTAFAVGACVIRTAGVERIGYLKVVRTTPKSAIRVLHLTTFRWNLTSEEALINV